jgi:hypothetical protein
MIAHTSHQPSGSYRFRQLARMEWIKLRAALAARCGRRGARDETAWTWWTLPSATAGCLAQRPRVFVLLPFVLT